MPGTAQPFRSHQRVALIVAIWFCAIVIQSQASGQSDQPDAVIAEVLIASPESFPVRVIERMPVEEPSADSEKTNGKVEAEDSTKSTFVFSPVELGPIRPRQLADEFPLPPEIAARREEIERMSLDRIFSGGMITDSVMFVPPAEPELVPSARRAKLFGSAAIVIAQAPDQPQIAQDSLQSRGFPAGAADGIEPTGTMTVKSLAEAEMRQGELIISDIVIETQRLPEPVVLGEPPPWLPAENVLPGMIEDDDANGLAAQGFPLLEEESAEEVHRLSPTDVQMRNYAMPGGGLDIYRLAPTRFSQTLPNAR